MQFCVNQVCLTITCTIIKSSSVISFYFVRHRYLIVGHTMFVKCITSTQSSIDTAMDVVVNTNAHYFLDLFIDLLEGRVISKYFLRHSIQWLYCTFVSGTSHQDTFIRSPHTKQLSSLFSCIGFIAVHFDVYFHNNSYQNLAISHFQTPFNARTNNNFINEASM